MATRPPWSDPQTETAQQIAERRRAAQRLRQRLTERRRHGLATRHRLKLAHLRDRQRERNDHDEDSSDVDHDSTGQLDHFRDDENVNGVRTR